MTDQETKKPPGDYDTRGHGRRGNQLMFTVFACQYTMTGPQFQVPVR